MLLALGLGWRSMMTGRRLHDFALRYWRCADGFARGVNSGVADKALLAFSRQGELMPLRVRLDVMRCRAMPALSSHS